LKTAVRNEAAGNAAEPQDVSDLCAVFRAAVLESTATASASGKLFQERFGARARWSQPGGASRPTRRSRGALQASPAERRPR